MHDKEQRGEPAPPDRPREGHNVVVPPALDPGEDAGLPRVQGKRRTPRNTLTPDGRLSKGRLAGLSMNRAIWVLSWPIVTESFLNFIVGATDTALSAQLSADATNAIGGASYFMWFVGLISMSIGIGATALVARAVGAGRIAVANAALGQAILLSLVAGAVGAVFLATCSGQLAELLSIRGNSRELFVSYLLVVAVGVPATSIFFTGLACIRGAGDNITPLRIMACVSVLNVVVSWLLSGVDISLTTERDSEIVAWLRIDNPSPIDLGVVGIAWGTTAAWFAGAVITLLFLIPGKPGIKLRGKRLRPHWHTMRRLIRLAVPNFLDALGMWVGNFLLLMMVGWISLAPFVDGTRGQDTLGSHIVAIRLEAISFMPGFSIGMAAATLVGQYLGAGSPGLARAAALRCTALAAIVMGSAGALFIFLPHTMVGLVSQQESHLQTVPTILIICGFAQIPFAIAIVLRSVLKGAGDVNAAMWLTWIATYAIRLPVCYALSGVDIPVPEWIAGRPDYVLQNPFFEDPSLIRCWIGMMGELTIRGVLFGARFLQGRWVQARV